MRVKVLLAVVCFALLANAAAAQVPTGTISGRVLDQGGDPVPGATITVTSPSLQGERTVVTSMYGDYSIPLLPPGDYTVRVELSGFQTVNRQIAVAATQTVPLDVTLAVGGVQESVTVTANAAAFLETATNATSVRQELTQTLPTSRTLVAAVLLAPNVHATGPNATNGADGSIAIGGAMSFDNLFMVNGVSVTENVRGQPFTLFIEDAIQETTVSTGGISAEYGRFGGGVVNAITKSGGNTFSGSYRQSFNNDAWRSLTPFEDALSEVPGPTGKSPKELAKAHKTVPTYEYTIGGPILKDRLWFFTAGRIQKQEQGRTTAAPASIPYVFTNDEKRYEGKLTYSPANSQTVRGSFTKIQQQVTNNNFNNVYDLRSLYNQNNPQDLLSLNYNGILGTRLAIEGQYSRRNFSFLDSGSPYTDLEGGTLLIDRSRGGTSFRYWAPTFCACNDDERNNTEFLAKATYFVSTNRFGAHTLVFGYDNYNDHRLSNNYQSGSNFRILGTRTTFVGSEVFPVFLGAGATGSSVTLIQQDPITQESQGADLRVHAGFVNDNWRWNSGVTLNLGLRFDKNDAVDAGGKQASTASRLSPRVGVTWDPAKDGRWAISGSFAKYASAISTSVVSEGSPAGTAFTYRWEYRGPDINAGTGPLLTSPQAIKAVFDWFNANGGASLPLVLADLPGVNQQIGGDLKSPYALEYSAGVSRTLGSRGTVRFDYQYRDFHDFYSMRTDLTTGRVSTNAGVFDIGVIGNSDDLKRRYQSGAVSTTYRLGRATLGGNYTVSRLWGNIDGENASSGPLTARLFQYPEYREAEWNLPEGNLFGDQRHRARVWGSYAVPIAERLGGLDVSLLFAAASGVPLGQNSETPNSPGLAVGQINPIPYVTNPGYANPLSGSTIDYFFFPRDQYRTEAQYRTDFSTNYKYRFAGHLEAFFHMEVLNIFDKFQLCGCGGTVFNNGGGSDARVIGNAVTTLQAFNPFTETPVEGVNWRLSPTFRTAANRYAYTSPRTFRFNVGVRF